MRVLVAMLVAALLGSAAASAEQVRLVSFNVERGFESDAEMPTVLGLMDDVGLADIWAIVEASPGDIDTFLKHLGKAYEGVEGRTDNGADVIVIIFDRRKFSRVDSDELFIPNLSFGQRQPLLDFNIVGYPQKGPPQGSAYPVLLEDDVWAWVRPDVLMPTQCGADYYSVLDFALVADEAKQWPRESKIWDIGCKNTPQRPDHLPIDLTITVP